MKLTLTLKLYPTVEQKKHIRRTMLEYISTVNRLTESTEHGADISKTSSKDSGGDMPSALRGQAAQDARSIVKKTSKRRKALEQKNQKLVDAGKPPINKVIKMPVLRKPCFYVNNENYTLKLRKNQPTNKRFVCVDVGFPVNINGKSHRLAVRTITSAEQWEILSTHNLCTMRVVCKGDSIVAQPVIDEVCLPEVDSKIIMGVDVGLKCPAVSYCSDGSVKFYGNGRMNRFIKRKYASKRAKLQKQGKLRSVKNISNKEQRIMKCIDHKISKEIVDNAVRHNVSIIRVEDISNIHKETRQSPKNTKCGKKCRSFNHALSSWSYYRLLSFIKYKAELKGIEVEFVNPAYTSQKCPHCGKKHKADDRDFICECGYHTHRDIVGAINICNSTERVDKRRAA